MSDAVESRSQPLPTSQGQSTVPEANKKPAMPKVPSPGEPVEKIDSDSKPPELSKTGDSAGEMASRPPPGRPLSSGAPMYRDQQHYNQSQQLFPVHTIPIVVHQSQQAKQRNNYSKVAMNRGRGAPAPAQYFVQHRRPAADTMPPMDEGPTVKQHLQEQQKQMKAKEKMYHDGRHYGPGDDGQNGNNPGPMTSTSQPTMQTIRTESGQILKTFTVQTLNSSAPIVMSGSRQMAPPQQQPKRPTPPHRALTQTEGTAPRPIAPRSRVTTTAAQSNSRKVKVIVQPGVTTSFTTAHQKQQLATQPYVVSTQPLSSNTGASGNVPLQIYPPASSQQQPIPIQPKLAQAAGTSRTETLPTKKKITVKRKPSEGKNPREFQALTTVVPVTTPSVLMRPQQHSQPTNSPPILTTPETDDGYPSEAERRRQIDPTEWEMRVRQIKEREQAILDQKLRENQEKERRMFDERHREECRKIDEKIYEEQQRRRVAEEDRRKQELELKEKEELEMRLRNAEFLAEDEALAELEILEQMELEEQVALLSQQSGTQLVHHTGMEVTIDDLLVTSEKDAAWNFEAMDPSQEQEFINESFLNFDEGVFFQEQMDYGQFEENNQYADMGYGQELHHQHHHPPQQFVEQQVYQEPAPMVENLFPIGEDSKEDPLSKLLSNPSIMEGFPDMFTDKSIFDSFPDLDDDLGNILDSSPPKKEPKTTAESPDLAISLVDWVMNDDHEDDDGEALLKLRDERLESTATEYMNVCAEVDFNFDIGPLPVEERPPVMQARITPDSGLYPPDPLLSQGMIPMPSNLPVSNLFPMGHHLAEKPQKAPTPPRVPTPPEAKNKKKARSPKEPERIPEPVIAISRPRDRRRLDDRSSRQKKSEMDAIEKEKEARQIEADRERVRQIMMMEEKAIEAERAAEALMKPAQTKKKSRATTRNRSHRSQTGSPTKATTPIATPKAITPPAPAIVEEPKVQTPPPPATQPTVIPASPAMFPPVSLPEMPPAFEPSPYQTHPDLSPRTIASSHPSISAALSTVSMTADYYPPSTPFMDPMMQHYSEECYDAGMTDPSFLDPSLLDPALLDPALLDPELLDPTMMDPSFHDPNLMETNLLQSDYMEDCPMENELDQYLGDPLCADFEKEWYTDLEVNFNPEHFFPMDPAPRPDRPLSEDTGKVHYKASEMLHEQPKQKARRSNSFTTGIEPDQQEIDELEYFVDEHGDVHMFPMPDSKEIDDEIIALLCNGGHAQTYSHMIEEAILAGDENDLEAVINQIETLELCDMYSDIPTDALYQMLESPGEVMTVEEIVRLRDEHGVNINEELQAEDVNCGIEIPHSVLENPDPEILAEYEWKKNLFQVFLLFTDKERMEEINFMEQQIHEVEAALEEHFGCKLKVLRDGLTSILYSNAAMVDEVSRISGKLLVTSEERKLLARRLCHHQRNYIRRLQTASKRRADAERRRKEMEAAGIFPTTKTGKKKSTPKKSAPVPGTIPKKRGRPFSKNLPRPPGSVGPLPSMKKGRTASASSSKSNASKKKKEISKQKKKSAPQFPGGLLPPPGSPTASVLKAILQAHQEKKKNRSSEAEVKKDDVKKEEESKEPPKPEETKETKPKKTKGMKGYVYEDVIKPVLEPKNVPEVEADPDAPIGLRKAPRRSTHLLNFMEFSPRGTPDPEDDEIIEPPPKKRSGRPPRSKTQIPKPSSAEKQKRPPSRASSRAKSEIDISEPSSPRSVAESVGSTKSDQDNESPNAKGSEGQSTTVSPETASETSEKDSRKMRPRRAAAQAKSEEVDDENPRKRRRLRVETPLRQSTRRKS